MKRRLALFVAVLAVGGGVATAVYIHRPKVNYDALAKEAGEVPAPPPGFRPVEEPKPKNDRFQIVQSPIMARLTFKLDSYTGDVWQLVVDKQGTEAWEPMPVLSLEKATAANEPRFQIFLSGVLARNTFLLDLQTGLSWILTVGKGSSVQWEPMASLPQ